MVIDHWPDTPPHRYQLANNPICCTESVSHVTALKNQEFFKYFFIYLLLIITWKIYAHHAHSKLYLHANFQLWTHCRFEAIVWRKIALSVSHPPTHTQLAHLMQQEPQLVPGNVNDLQVYEILFWHNNSTASILGSFCRKLYIERVTYLPDSWWYVLCVTDGRKHSMNGWLECLVAVYRQCCINTHITITADTDKQTWRWFTVLLYTDMHAASKWNKAQKLEAMKKQWYNTYRYETYQMYKLRNNRRTEIYIKCRFWSPTFLSQCNKVCITMTKIT